jgi:hypothetical protein
VLRLAIAFDGLQLAIRLIPPPRTNVHALRLDNAAGRPKTLSELRSFEFSAGE